ncbi:hypothetical protein TH53_07165 [Pedobacter lusitanus]|uniref:Contig29, whole genome shotgun sequence n=1 Tax=Pedobacter lusitanus TaxID=1503925 RepID=A0A0D0GNG1_9SPHI|nr:hypothetical protein [Pedobacter lusitanus]KIO77715.1 hypothetical protein TH53_07165 [Pedobacter lusitanus]
MEIIKNIYKLVGIVRHIDLLRLEEGAKQYLTQLNISFEIITAKSSALKVKTRQWKCRKDNLAEIPKLITLTKDLFERFLTDIPVTVHPIAYTPAVADNVEPEWINNKMLTLDVKLKDINRDTGIDKLSLSSWINGTEPMSQDVKAMFFYYFESIGQKNNQHSTQKEFSEPCYN